MSSSQSIGKEIFGAQVVTATLDKLNNTKKTPLPSDKEGFDAAVVSGTLDNLNNSRPTPANSTDYTFQKDVLSAAYEGKGTIIDSKG